MDTLRGQTNILLKIIEVPVPDSLYVTGGLFNLLLWPHNACLQKEL